MSKNRGTVAKFKLSMLALLMFTLICMGSALAADVAPADGKADNGSVNWRENTENGKVNAPGIDHYGVGIDWAVRRRTP